MLRYLPGIVMVQVVTLALFWVNQGASAENMLLRMGLPALFIAAITALWLSTIGRVEAERRSAKLVEQHNEERERLNRLIERTRSDVLQKASADQAKMLERAHGERERLVEKTHKQLLQRERSISRRANVKVGLAFMGMTGLGVLMLITELLTLGLMTITTAGGAMGGYLLRWRQGRRALDRLSAGPENAILTGSGSTVAAGSHPVASSRQNRDRRATAALSVIELDAENKPLGASASKSD